MDKYEVIAKLRDERIVAVIRGKDKDEVVKTVEAVYCGGVHLMEITFTVPKAEEIICELDRRYADAHDVVIGVGTCMDIVSARMAISAGARFVVCPHLDVDIMKLCNSYAVPCFPGAATMRDMHEALEYGAPVIKLFPGDVYGPDAIKAFMVRFRKRSSCRPGASMQVTSKHGWKRVRSRLALEAASREERQLVISKR